MGMKMLMFSDVPGAGFPVICQGIEPAPEAVFVMTLFLTLRTPHRMTRLLSKGVPFVGQRTIKIGKNRRLS